MKFIFPATLKNMQSQALSKINTQGNLPEVPVVLVHAFIFKQ